MAGLFGGKKIIRQYLGANLLWEAHDATVPVLSDVTAAVSRNGSNQIEVSPTGTLDETQYSWGFYSGTETDPAAVPTGFITLVPLGDTAVTGSTFEDETNIIAFIVVGTDTTNQVASGLIETLPAVAPAATEPAAFNDAEWSLSDSPSTSGDKLDLTISALPDDGGSAITSLEYQVDSGSGYGTVQTLTGAGLDSRLITVLQETTAMVQIRAVNSVNPGPWSDTKTATPTVQAEVGGDDDVIVAYWGQSELMNATTSFYEGGAGTATDPIHQPLLEEGRVTIWWHDRNPEGNGAAGVRSEVVTNATTNTRFKAMANAMIPDLPAGRNGVIIFQTRSGTGFQALVDDVLPRSWDDEVALHNAATDNGAKMVSAVHFSWHGSPRGFQSRYGEAVHAIVFGRSIDGTEYGPRPFTVFPGGGDNEFQAHHILADLYDFSEGRTKVIIGEPHRYEAPGGDYEAACRDATRAMYAQSNEPSLTFGHPSLIYRNGKRDSTTGLWDDYAHPSSGEGSRRIMAGLVASSMQALGYAGWQPPSITNSYFAPDGSYMECWSAAGPIQTIHGTLACGVKIDGSFIDGTIVNVADGAQVDGAIRITAEQAGIPKFTGTTNISFIKDNITGLSTIEEAEFGWMKYPAVDLGAAGFPSGVPVINNPEPTVFANDLPKEGATYPLNGTTGINSKGYTHPTTTQPYTIKTTLIIDGTVGNAFEEICRDTDNNIFLAVGDGQIRTAAAGGGVPLEISPVEYSPGNRVTFTQCCDPATGNYQVYLNGPVAEGGQLVRSASGTAIPLQTNREFRLLYGIIGELEEMTIWQEYSSDGSDPASAPLKRLRGGSLFADAGTWEVRDDGVTLNPVT